MATGMLADNTKVLFYREEFMPLSIELLRNMDHVASIRQAVTKAEKVGGALNQALNMLAAHVLLNDSKGKPQPKQRDS